MELTKQQQETITGLEKELSDYLWEKLYYHKENNPDVWNLYKEGVELNFSVKVTPYEGLNFVK